jgi:hypothetical protein
VLILVTLSPLVTLVDASAKQEAAAAGAMEQLARGLVDKSAQ